MHCAAFPVAESVVRHQNLPKLRKMVGKIRSFYVFVKMKSNAMMRKKTLVFGIRVVSRFHIEIDLEKEGFVHNIILKSKIHRTKSIFREQINLFDFFPFKKISILLKECQLLFGQISSNT